MEGDTILTFVKVKIMILISPMRRRREFNFVKRFEEDFEAKLWKSFRYFEKDERIKRQNGRLETRISVTSEVFSLLKFVQRFIKVRKVVSSSKNRKF